MGRFQADNLHLTIQALSGRTAWEHKALMPVVMAALWTMKKFSHVAIDQTNICDKYQEDLESFALCQIEQH